MRSGRANRVITPIGAPSDGHSMPAPSRSPAWCSPRLASTWSMPSVARAPGAECRDSQHEPTSRWANIFGPRRQDDYRTRPPSRGEVCGLPASEQDQLYYIKRIVAGWRCRRHPSAWHHRHERRKRSGDPWQAEPSTPKLRARPALMYLVRTAAPTADRRLHRHRRFQFREPTGDHIASAPVYLARTWRLRHPTPTGAHSRELCPEIPVRRRAWLC